MAKGADLLFAVLCAMLGGPASANSNDSPARLLEGEHSIESLVRIPEALASGLYVVQCETWVLPSGRAREFACYSETKLQGLSNVVAAAGKQAMFAPATRNGHLVAIYMLVMVRIYITADGPLILAVPNNGIEADKYGLLYTAPQRLTDITWPHENGWHHMYEKAKPLLMWQVLHIDQHGKMTDYELKDVSRAQHEVVQHFRKQVERLEFMPGWYEGRPVPMLYVEPVYTRRDYY